MNDVHLAIAPDAEWMEIDDAVLVLHDQRIHLLTGSSAEIWHSVGASTSSTELAQAISERHAASAHVFDDVVGFVADLTARGLLVEVEAPLGNDYRVPAHVAWTAEDDGSVAIADLRSSGRHSLSATGALIWTMTAQGAPREAVHKTVLDAFPDAPEGYAEQVDDLLDSLVDQGLLELRRSKPLPSG